MTILWRFVLDRHRSMIGWALGAFVLVIVTVAFYPTIRDQPSIEEVMRDLPDAFKASFGIDDAVPVSSPAGYLQARLFALTLPVSLVIFGIGSGARAIGGSEQDGEVELLLAHPVTRHRLVIERFVAVMVLTLALGSLFMVLLFALGPPFGALKGLSVLRLLASCAGAMALGLFHTTLAFAVGAVTGRRSTSVSVATAVAGGGYLLNGLLAAAGAPDAARFLSPWFWYLRRNMLVEVEPVDLLAFALPLASVVALFILSLVTFDRRDLR